MKDNDDNARVRAVKEMKCPDKPLFRPHSTNEKLYNHYYHKHFNIIYYKRKELDRN